MIVWWILLSAVAESALLTGILRRYALAHSVLDIPNDRSSHTLPTPRGGGVAIVATFLTGVAILAALGLVDFSVAMALSGAVLVVALVGFIDDHRHVPAERRLIAHFLAAVWALAWLGGLPPLQLLGTPVSLGWVGHALAAVYLVWLLNLYNFMDGIDGLAGLEAVTVGLAAAVLYGLHPPSGREWVLSALLSMSALGFLVWNWPPARIFVGDAGSGALGMILGILSIQAAWVASAFLWSSVILLGVFVVDATITLLRRLKRREKLHVAHRSHAYQHAARQFGAHKPVTLAVGAINLLWLLPMAMLVVSGRLGGLPGVLIAYAPLVWLAIRFEAGASLQPVERSGPSLS